MPMYWNPDLGVKKPLTMDDYEASLGDSMDIGFRTAYDLNPAQILKRNQAMSGWESGIDLLDATQELDPTLSLDEYQSQIARPVVPVEEQERQIKDAGLEGQLKAKEGYNQETINIIIENKQIENLASLVRERAPGWHIIPDFASGFAASMLDPVNLATAIVPVVGEQRLFSMLRAAKGAWGRAGVRAGVGAASGALGAVIMEPGIALGQMELQADYSFTQSLLNISMGAAMGAVLQPGFGALGEWRRNWRGISHPWEFVEADEETRAMMKAHADEIYTHRMQSSAIPNKLQFREEADYYAALFDARARTWAYKENRSVADYYAENKPAYRNWQDFDPDGWRDVLPPEWRNAGSQIGDELDDLSWIGRDYEGLKALNADAMTAPQFLEELGKWEERFPDMTDFGEIRAQIQDIQARGASDAIDGSLNHAMYRNKAASIDEFLEKYDQLIKSNSDTYFDFQHRKINRQDSLANNYEVWLGITQVRHIKERHPDFKNWDKIPDVLENGRSQRLGPNRLTGKDAYLFTLQDGDKTVGVIGAPVTSKNRGNRIVVLTAFRDSDSGIQNWATHFKKEEAVSFQGTGGSPANPSSQRSVPLGSENGLSNVDTNSTGVKSGNLDVLTQPRRKNVILTGHKSRILAANSSEVGRYEVWELDNVIASHDPERQFARRDDYPEIAQERPYHSDLGEQEKVIENAIAYQPDYVISTDATAVNGPPIITSDGIVLGGNSRVMTLGMVYGKHPEKAAAYRQMLQDRGAMFGIDPNAVSGMKKPVLVRTVSGKLTPEEMAQRSREYNQSPGQSLQAQAEGVSRARFIGRQSMNLLATGLKDNESLAKFLDSDRSADFVNAMLDEGVILRTEKSALTNPDGTLNNVGKDRVTGIMRGLVGVLPVV